MARIGKYVIDSLTRSMYKDSRCIYREYIQNAADQIDIAREQHLEEDNYYDVHVRIFREERRIEIEDTATGVGREQRETLLDVATSTKERGKRKGFRGIGRLGGLGYCKTLIFETSAKGEAVKTIMTWDAKKMNAIVDDELDDKDASLVIDDCTSFEEHPEGVEKHYFKVVMQDVTDDRLLNVEDIKNYLSMVSPVDYPTSFVKYSAKIKNYAKDRGLSLDVYSIFVGDEYGEDQLYKKYTTRILNKRDGDYDIQDINFFQKEDTDGSLIYWGWYSISELKGIIQSYNPAYGMRLRCHNIQVGDEETCKLFFPAEGDKRFAQYFFGELHVVTDKLLPDARRDYLRECEFRAEFESYVISDFITLKELANEASDVRGQLKIIRNADAKREVIATKRNEHRFVSPAERQQAEDEYNKLAKDREKAQKKLKNLKAKSDESSSPLGFIYGTISDQANCIISEPQTSANTSADLFGTESASGFTGLRTDNDIYLKFGPKEKKIINKVYEVIYNVIADEDKRESLINKIERELTR